MGIGAFRRGGPIFPWKSLPSTNFRACFSAMKINFLSSYHRSKIGSLEINWASQVLEGSSRKVKIFKLRFLETVTYGFEWLHVWFSVLGIRSASKPIYTHICIHDLVLVLLEATVWCTADWLKNLKAWFSLYRSVFVTYG